MNKLLRLGVVIGTISTGVGINVLPAHASLIGDTVDCDITTNFWSCSPTSAIVTDSASEFTLNLFGFPNFSIDIDDSSITMTSLNFFGGGSGEFVTFSDLDWTNGGGEIVGFSLDVSGVTGLTESDISFSADLVGIDFNDTFWDIGDSIVVNLETIHAATPEPSSLLGFLSLGIGGVASTLKRKRK